MNWSERYEKQFQEIYKITKEVCSFYVNLCDLEIQGKKGTEEYQKLFQYLSICLDIETKKYDKIGFNQQKINDWLKHISKFLSGEEFPSNLDSIIVQDYNNMIYRRMMCLLLPKIIYTNITHEQRIMNYFKKINVNKKDIIFLSNLVGDAIETDILRGYLYNLNSLCQKKEYKSMLKYFIQSKYFASLISKSIEDDFIHSNFEIADSLYLESTFISNITQLNDTIFEDYKNEYVSYVIDYNISNLLAYKNKDYNYDIIASSALLMQCLIKSGMILASQNIYQELKEKYEEVLKSSELLKDNYNHEISVHLIDECFEQYHKENNNIYKVWFKKKK